MLLHRTHVKLPIFAFNRLRKKTWVAGVLLGRVIWLLIDRKSTTKITRLPAEWRRRRQPMLSTPRRSAPSAPRRTSTDLLGSPTLCRSKSHDQLAGNRGKGGSSGATGGKVRDACEIQTIWDSASNFLLGQWLCTCGGHGTKSTHEALPICPL